MKLFQMPTGSSQPLRSVATVAATFLGGTFAIGFLASSVSERVTLFKKKKYGKPCRICKAIGHYTCKLCKGNGTIIWSPLYDPVFINPCVCPTCDGFNVESCLKDETGNAWVVFSLGVSVSDIVIFFPENLETVNVLQHDDLKP